MSASISPDLIEDLVTPLSDCFTPDVARQVATLRASEELQKRIHDLGEKCSRGELSDQERVDYETIVRFNKFMALIQSKARKFLKDSGE